MKTNIPQISFRQLAANDLKNYPYISASLVTLPQKIRMLQQNFETGAIHYDSPNVQHSLDSDGYTVNKLYEIEKLEKTLLENNQRAKIIKSALESLTEDDRQLLTDFYMNKISCVKLSQRFCIDRSSLYRKVNTALDRYILACYGVEKAG